MRKFIALFRLTLPFLMVFTCSAYAADWSVEATLSNPYDHDLEETPVFVRIADIFGQSMDVTKLSRSGFRIRNENGKDVPYYYRVMPPAFSLATDELVFLLPTLAKGASTRYTFSNSSTQNTRQQTFDMARFVSHKANLIPNAGFEKGSEGWHGGKIVSDTRHGGGKALLLEAMGKSRTEAACSKILTLNKKGRYYINVFAKSENVARYGHRFQNLGGRIGFSNGAFRGRSSVVQDTRDWYPYRPEFSGFFFKPGYSGEDGYEPAWQMRAMHSVPNGETNKGKQSPIAKAGYKTQLKISLPQDRLYYLDNSKPGRIWIDDILVFEQPKIVFDYFKTLTDAKLENEFVYQRPINQLCGHPDFSMTARPFPWEQVASIKLSATRGERKAFCVGIALPRGGKQVTVEMSELTGPGKLDPRARDIEYLIHPWHEMAAKAGELWVRELESPCDYDKPCHMEFFIAQYIDGSTKPGTYAGTVTLKAGGKVLRELPLTLTVEDVQLDPLKEHFVGSIFNGGKCANGMSIDDQFLRIYRRSNFPYIMMFTRWLPFKPKSHQIDIEKLLSRMRQAVDKGGITAGVGIYHDVSMDKWGKGGLWARVQKNRDKYREQIKLADKALADAGLPRLIYMIWDEPRKIQKSSFNILAGTGAYTTCDAMGNPFGQMINYITHNSFDDPCQGIGTAIYKHCQTKKAKYGFCGSCKIPHSGRFQTGLLLAGSGAHYWHTWHLGKVQGKRGGKYFRHHTGLAQGEGVLDLQYVVTLQNLIAKAKKTGNNSKAAKEAEKYLETILSYCNGDQSAHCYYYNGTPFWWGDYWFYDHFRTNLLKYMMQLQ